MAHKLVAHGIGGRTVEELSETMSLEEFLRWMAFAALEPFGEERQDWRVAMLMAQQANMHRGKGKAAIPVKRFLPRFRSEQRSQSMREMEIALMSQFTALGGKLPED